MANSDVLPSNAFRDMPIVGVTSSWSSWACGMLALCALPACFDRVHTCVLCHRDDLPNQFGKVWQVIS